MTITQMLKPKERLPIQSRSSNSVRVFWLNLRQVKIRLEQAVERLTRTHPEIEEVWLFGSLSRGDTVPGSDADLLIILSDSLLLFLERSVFYQPESCGVGVEVFAYTCKEINKMKADRNRFVESDLTERVCLFRRAIVGSTAESSTSTG